MLPTANLWQRLFQAHPASVGESYVEHLGVASSFGIRMLLGGLACLAHGLFPFLFTSTGSALIRQLHGEMVEHRRRQDLPATLMHTAGGE